MAARIVASGPVLTPDDVADRLAAIGETFADTTPGEVAVVDGFGARLVIERGHLQATDGIGETRRQRRWPKTESPRRVVVGVGTEGNVSFGALRWAAQVGTSVVALGRDAAILAAGPPGRTTARLLRAQPLALYGPVGVEIAAYLIGCKLRGEAKVLRRLGDEGAAGMLAEMAEAVGSAPSIEQVRAIEAGAANLYWSIWEREVEATFTRRDRARVPDAWCRFNGRRSAVNPGSPRSATDPTGALLNYEYKLTEVESTLALRRLGLSESLGVLHADLPNRASFSCDVQEAIRPMADDYVLDIVAGPLRKRTFSEDARGVVRVMAPLSHRLADAMPAYAAAVGTVVETVAGLLAASSPYDVRVPTILTGARHKQAARRRVAAERAGAVPQLSAPIGPNPGGIAPRGHPRRKVDATLPMPEVVCQGCGAKLPVETDRARTRRGWCDECLPERRGEIGSAMQAASRTAAEMFAEMAGALPTHTSEATAARRAANARQVAAQRAWEHADTGALDGRWYAEEVAPKLAAFTLPAIARATGASTSAASKWRSGRMTPHRRHWAALAELAGVDVPAGVAP